MRPLVAPLFILLLAASPARAADGFEFTDTLFPGRSLVHVTAGYLASTDAWESDIGGGAYAEAIVGAYVPGTLYGTLFGAEGRLQLGYPLTPSLPLVSLEASAMLSPLWFRVGSVVLRFTGTGGFGLGGPESVHWVVGARAQLFSEAFGVGLHAQYIPGGTDDAPFQGGTRLEASLSVGPVDLGVRWFQSKFRYQPDDQPAPSAPFLVLQERSALGGFVGAHF